MLTFQLSYEEPVEDEFLNGRLTHLGVAARGGNLDPNDRFASLLWSSDRIRRALLYTSPRVRTGP